MIKALEIKISLLFNLDFANNTILSCFAFFFLIIDLYFLIPAVIAKCFNHTANFAMSIRILFKEAKAEIGTDLATTKAKLSKCAI